MFAFFAQSSLKESQEALRERKKTSDVPGSFKLIGEVMRRERQQNISNGSRK